VTSCPNNIYETSYPLLNPWYAAFIAVLKIVKLGLRLLLLEGKKYSIAMIKKMVNVKPMLN